MAFEDSWHPHVAAVLENFSIYRFINFLWPGAIAFVVLTDNLDQDKQSPSRSCINGKTTD
ncbi:unnamed protein product [Clonostachys rosea f. rosea IK726]|uniref:Uncharacterized protein n=1 Tax=Clonostachys rosea f. rosea IK726 TaxID=1349383 RepID=A0ACA9UQE2_BIOOC|nr:unnamed protein product [Clonostachys rosea f. rosea IK726]